MDGRRDGATDGGPKLGETESVGRMMRGMPKEEVAEEVMTRTKHAQQRSAVSSPTTTTATASPSNPYSTTSPPIIPQGLLSLLLYPSVPCISFQGTLFLATGPSPCLFVSALIPISAYIVFNASQGQTQCSLSQTAPHRSSSRLVLYLQQPRRHQPGSVSPRTVYTTSTPLQAALPSV